MTFSVVLDGLEYFTASELTGLADANGQFGYYSGDDITFKVGGAVLGTSPPQKKSPPVKTFFRTLPMSIAPT